MLSDFYLGLATDVPQMAEAPPYREMLRKEMAYPVQAAIRWRCGDHNVTVAGQVIGQAVPDDWSLALDPKLIAASAQHLRGVPELYSALTRYLSALDEKLNLLKENWAPADALVAAIEAERD